MRLQDIGFYTLSDERALATGPNAPLARCELILTDRCNFRCPYCRGLKQEYWGDMPWREAAYVVTQWQSQGLQNIRFSGGEPTLYRGIAELVSLAAKSCKRIAISTNGTASRELYGDLMCRGVNDFSVSLDACCSATCDKMVGRAGMLDKITRNIRYLAGKTYVTVGIVLTPENAPEVEHTVALAKGLGVADIRVISAAQLDRRMDLDLSGDGYPILRYRMDNVRSGRPVRGLCEGDSRCCFLVLDDMAVVGRHHYPCIIYLREQGKPMGEFSTISEVRKTRVEWSKSHDSFTDPICRENCLDVCVDYNNRAMAR